MPFYKKIEAKKTEKVESTVVCPGGGSQCPAGTTCCELSDGEYGCCPLTNAVVIHLNKYFFLYLSIFIKF